MALELYVEEGLKEVLDRANTALTTNFKFFFGEDEHVIKVMRDMKASNQQWSPLFAVELPINVSRGNQGGYYGIATVKRVVIATITDPSKSPHDRREIIIKPIIEPFYNEFIEQMCKQKTFAVMGKRIEHTPRVRYGTQQAAHGFTEYIDGIEILDLKITLKQT